MSFPQARWDCVQQGSSCNGNESCTWDFRNLNFVNGTTGVPAVNTATYICDNEKHALMNGGEDYGNYYIGAYGAHPRCTDALPHFQYPWQAESGKSCNLVLECNTMGNDAGASPSKGVCLQAAASHRNLAASDPAAAALYGADT